MACILVVDDDEDMRFFVRWVLEAEGHDVVVAPEGERGLKIMRAQPIALLVTDIVMPGKEGLALIPEVRQQWPDVKILAVSAGGRLEADDYLVMAEALGADTTLEKPVKRSGLAEAVAKLLAG